MMAPQVLRTKLTATTPALYGALQHRDIHYCSGSNLNYEVKIFKNLEIYSLQYGNAFPIVASGLFNFEAASECRIPMPMPLWSRGCGSTPQR